MSNASKSALRAGLVESTNGKVHGYMLGYDDLYGKGTRFVTAMCGKSLNRRGIDRDEFESTKITCLHCKKQVPNG